VSKVSIVKFRMFLANPLVNTLGGFINLNMSDLRSTMDALLNEAIRIRKAAVQSPLWNLNIDALLETNNECFAGPVLRADMEACYNFVMDQYDPHLLIKEGFLKPEQYESYLENIDGNPFYSLIELDEQRNIKNIWLEDTADCELVGEFLSKKYKWSEDE
jgi:hypothetical protein